MDDGIQLAQYKLMMEAYLSWERNFWTKFQILVGFQLAVFVISARATLGSQTLLIGVSILLAILLAILLVILSGFTWKILCLEIQDQKALFEVVRSLEWDSRGRLYLLKRVEEVGARLTPREQKLSLPKKVQRRKRKETTRRRRLGRKPELARSLSLVLFVVWVLLFLFLLVVWVVRCAIALLPLAEAIWVWFHGC